MARRKKKYGPINSIITITTTIEEYCLVSKDFHDCWLEAQKTYKSAAARMGFLDFPEKISTGFKKDRQYNFQSLLLFAEKCACEGNEEVQNIICTSFLESLLFESGKFPDFMAPVLRHLGPECRRYALAWNKFISVKSKGLE